MAPWLTKATGGSGPLTQTTDDERSTVTLRHTRQASSGHHDDHTSSAAKPTNPATSRFSIVTFTNYQLVSICHSVKTHSRAQRVWVKKLVKAGSCIFPTDSCNCPTLKCESAYCDTFLHNVLCLPACCLSVHLSHPCALLKPFDKCHLEGTLVWSNDALFHQVAASISFLPITLILVNCCCISS